MLRSSKRHITAISRDVARRSALPIAAMRKAPWPTSGAMLMAVPRASTARRYCAKLRHDQSTSTDQ